MGSSASFRDTPWPFRVGKSTLGGRGCAVWRSIFSPQPDGSNNWH